MVGKRVEGPQACDSFLKPSQSGENCQWLLNRLFPRFFLFKFNLVSFNSFYGNNCVMAITNSQMVSQWHLLNYLMSSEIC